MTIFEYLSVAASIVLALGVSRLASSIRHVFDSSRRDAVHAALFVLLFLIHLLHWWRLWPLHDVQAWNFLQFLIVMGGPISLYIAASVLVSDEPAEVVSWRAHLAEAHRWFFSVLAASIVFGVLQITLVLEAQLQLLLAVVVIAPLLVGAVLPNRKVHIAVTAIAWVNVLLVIRDFFRAS